MTARWMTPVLAAAILAAAPAYAADKPAEGDEKLPAQLPSVTIQGQDLSGSADRGTKLAPDARAAASRIRLPEPAQRRATRDDTKSLMVNVTPSTLEAPAPLPGMRLPYTSLLAGWGPITQYRLGLYDARMWGPVLGITDLAGRGGWDWSGWQAQEALDWAGYGRGNFQANGFGWSKGLNKGTQTFFAGTAEYGEGENLQAGLDVAQGTMQAQAGTAAAASLGALTTAARGKWRPAPNGDHQAALSAQAQYRQWGVQAGPEAYMTAEDFWSLSDQVQLQGALGGGYWGRELIIDPTAEFHYRPTPATHLHAGLKTASELPSFAQLYLNRASSAAMPNLNAERVEGWATAGGSHRFNETLWANLDLGLRRSWRHIYWQDAAGTGLWAPANAAGEQWSPTGGLRLQFQVPEGPQLELGYAGNAVFPLGTMDHAVDARLDAGFLERKLTVSLGLQGRLASLVAAQTPGGGSASGAFALAEAKYQLTPDWSLGLHATEVPLALSTLGTTYFAPNPWLTFDAQYQF